MAAIDFQGDLRNVIDPVIEPAPRAAEAEATDTDLATVDCDPQPEHLRP